MTTVKLHLSGDPGPLPVVLLAPFPLDAQVWDDVRSRLDVPVVTVDPPGFAGTEVDREPSLETYAGTLLEALDAAGIGRFVVAGNSMGGYAAMALAALHPERLAGIGLLGTKAAADATEARDNRLSMAERAESGVPAAELVGPMLPALISDATRADSPATVDRLKAWLAEAPPAGIAWAQRAMAARPDRIEALRALGVPGLVMHGSADALMGPEVQLPMAEALGVEVDTVADRGHLLPIEAPDRVATALTELWRRAQA